MSCWNGGWVTAGTRDDGTLSVFSSPTGRGSCPGDAYLGDDPTGRPTSARSFASSLYSMINLDRVQSGCALHSDAPDALSRAVQSSPVTKCSELQSARTIATCGVWSEPRHDRR
jgi:hypothetical protein